MRVAQINKSRIISELSASMAPAPEACFGFPLPVLSENCKSLCFFRYHLFERFNNVTFTHLSEATRRIQVATAQLHHELSLAMEAWEAREEKSDYLLPPGEQEKIHQTLSESIAFSGKITSAIKSILSDDKWQTFFPDEAAQTHFKSELIKFGRVVAGFRFAAEDFLSHFTQVKPPERTSTPELPNPEEVRALIIREHEKLGLSAPEFH